MQKVDNTTKVAKHPLDPPRRQSIRPISYMTAVKYPPKQNGAKVSTSEQKGGEHPSNDDHYNLDDADEMSEGRQMTTIIIGRASKTTLPGRERCHRRRRRPTYKVKAFTRKAPRRGGKRGKE